MNNEIKTPTLPQALSPIIGYVGSIRFRLCIL
ncbi:Na(+)/H(+) antiporter [Pasteurella multocida]|nr:Na(+)/H(+) antiporter [Pasteurella multocida]